MILEYNVDRLLNLINVDFNEKESIVEFSANKVVESILQPFEMDHIFHPIILDSIIVSEFATLEQFF